MPNFVDLDQLAHERTAVLTTFRRDGSPVPTAIHLVVDQGRAYFRTWNTTGKVKRIRNNPHVEIAPSTFTGKPIGETVPATARLMEPHEPGVRLAKRALPRKNWILQPLVPALHRLMGRRTLYYEMTVREDKSSRQGG